HDALELAISATCAAHEDPLIISVHSFTPRLTGDAQIRPWHVGLLWQEDEATARQFMSLLREDTDFLIGDNQPYNARGFSYSIDCHVVLRDLRHLTLEIRQDLISSAADVEDMARKLSAVICKL
ncbi:MAG: N-formylglutamate amidohydrolase, partial [Hyphomonadaceae bacterium]